MEEFLLNIFSNANKYLSDYVLVFLLVGVGIFYTIRTRFVQVRCFGEGMKKVFGGISLNGKKQKSGMSSFQAFTTAVAAQVGTGNIVGACGAILAGGPGAIFWMWVIAFFGMATIYSEAVLAQKTRQINPDGSISGGPVYYIKKAFKGGFGKFLAGFFAVATIIALGLIGTMVQSNAIGSAVHEATTIPSWIIGVIIAIIALIIFIGGISRLASVTEKLVPIMAIIYIIGGLIVICCRIQYVPETFGMIFKYAFMPQAVIGGGIGFALKTAISQGAKRGLFSNEAGMGSTPHAHAQANVKTPHEQGITAMIGLFIDTFVVLTITALVVITTLYAGNGEISRITTEALANGKSGEQILEILKSAGFDKNTTVKMAIASLFTNASVGNQIASIFIAICLLFFAFSTILSWNLFGKINFEYLFKKKATIVYSIIAIAFIILGSFLQNDLVWELTDFFNYLMVLPNALALFALSKMVVQELKDRDNRKKGILPLNDDKQTLEKSE